MAKKRIRLFSWNVNGLRAVMKKDFFKSVAILDVDVLAFQEEQLFQYLFPQRSDE